MAVDLANEKLNQLKANFNAYETLTPGADYPGTISIAPVTASVSDRSELRRAASGGLSHPVFFCYFVPIP
jgi:hypothetical protein